MLLKEPLQIGTNFVSEVVLVIVAHPDDEALGCGGTIAKHVKNGDEVNVLFLTNGVSARLNQTEKNINERTKNAKKAGKILGLKQMFFKNFPDNQLDTVPMLQITKTIEEIILITKPKIIYTHHYGDLNIDHRITHSAVMTASRPLPDTSVKEIYTFEVLSSTEWSYDVSSIFFPTMFVDIEDFFNQKVKSLEAYSIEMREHPHSRSIEHIKALAVHRGASIGKNKAESFMVMRLIN
jgi:N-acetylglucosamine malate deacetylase 1